MKHLKVFNEFYLGSDSIVGVKFKLKEPIEFEGNEYNTEDIWIIDRAVDDNHYCHNINTGEKSCFHTDIILDAIMSREDSLKFR